MGFYLAYYRGNEPTKEQAHRSCSDYDPTPYGSQGLCLLSSLYCTWWDGCSYPATFCPFLLAAWREAVSFSTWKNCARMQQLHTITMNNFLANESHRVMTLLLRLPDGMRVTKVWMLPAQMVPVLARRPRFSFGRLRIGSIMLDPRNDKPSRILLIVTGFCANSRMSVGFLRSRRLVWLMSLMRHFKV